MRAIFCHRAIIIVFVPVLHATFVLPITSNRFLQACGVQTQEQLCKYMISSYRAFELRIYKDVHQQKATALPRASNVETINDGASKQCGTGRQLSGARSSSGTSHLFDICPDLLVEMAGKLKGRMLGAGQLEDAVDW